MSSPTRTVLTTFDGTNWVLSSPANTLLLGENYALTFGDTVAAFGIRGTATNFTLFNANDEPVIQATETTVEVSCDEVSVATFSADGLQLANPLSTSNGTIHAPTGMTPLADRRLQNGDNIRVLLLGDSIAEGVLWADNVGAFRLAQNAIGNAGAGGIGVGTETIQFFDGSTAYSTANPADWFIQYVIVPAASSYEFSNESRVRRWCNTAKVAWRAPVGGTATFKIQTCTDNDGAGVGTWVDQGGVRTAVASGGNEEVGYATVTLTEGNYRLRVLGVSGTVHVLNMELSHSDTGGVVLIPHTQGSTSFGTWAAMSQTMRETFIEATDPDVVVFIGKDDAATMATALPVLLSTLNATLKSGYRRDLVLIAPIPTVNSDDPLGDADGVMMWEQRNQMLDWASANYIPIIDGWNLAPSLNVYYDGPGVHLAGTEEFAHLGNQIMQQMGWLDYPTVRQKKFKSIPLTTYTAVTDTTTLYEFADLRLRGLGEGRWRITGLVHFSHGATAEGGKAEVSVSSIGTNLASYFWEKFGTGATPGAAYIYPEASSFNGPVEMNGAKAAGYSGGFTYRIDETVVLANPGDIIIKIAKEATGGAVYIREGTKFMAEKLD